MNNYITVFFMKFQFCASFERERENRFVNLDLTLILVFYNIYIYRFKKKFINCLDIYYQKRTSKLIIKSLS